MTYNIDKNMKTNKLEIILPNQNKTMSIRFSASLNYDIRSTPVRLLDQLIVAKPPDKHDVRSGDIYASRRTTTGHVVEEVVCAGYGRDFDAVVVLHVYPTPSAFKGGSRIGP